MKICSRVDCDLAGKKQPEENFEPRTDNANRRPDCRACRARDRRGQRAPPAITKRFTRALDAHRYIVTSAQNATPVDANFWAALKAAAEHLDAEIVVIPFRYKNPTSRWEKRRQEEGTDTEEWWVSEVVPHLFNTRKKLCENLVLAGDVKIQPTASSPLTGFEALTGAESCIIGHPKMQFRTIATPSNRFPKILTTTGSCTVRDYSDTKAGKLGAFHHFLGAIVVEIEGKRFHLRQINADRKDGSFTDLDRHYSAAGVTDAPPALALIMGDTHIRVSDPEVDRATFGAAGMVEVLNPQALVFHDIFDGETVNPHEVGNPFLAEARRRAGRQEVQSEVEEVITFIDKRAGSREVVIVDSNHHRFLERWMIRTDWRQDLKNAKFYLQTALAMLDSARMTPGGAEYADPFTYWLGRLGVKCKLRCLGPDESYKVADVECGMHGHNGPSGAKGTVKNLSRLGAKTTTGHGHAPAIEEGHYRVGTGTPRRQSYQRGPSANLQTNCVIYATGKRALLTVVGDSWRLLEK